MKDHALVIDYKYCDGCNSCILACRNAHKLPLDQWGIKVMEVKPEKLDGKWMWNYIPYVSPLCDLCEERVQEGKVVLYAGVGQPDARTEALTGHASVRIDLE